MTKRYYDIVYSKLALLLLPTELRKQIIIELATAMVRPIEVFHEDFMKWSNSLETETKSQVCYMRGLLNDEFDYFDRRIKIRVTPIDFDYYLFWQEEQNKPVMLWDENSGDYTPFMISRDGYIGSTNTDFDIIFPLGYTLSKEEMIRLKSMVNQHRLASKTYKIVNE